MRSAPLRPSGGSTLSRWSWSPKSSSVRNSRSHCGAQRPTAARRTSSTPEFTHPCLLRGHESATSNAGAMRATAASAPASHKKVSVSSQSVVAYGDCITAIAFAMYPKKRWQCRPKRRSYSAHFARYGVASASVRSGRTRSTKRRGLCGWSVTTHNFVDGDAARICVAAHLEQPPPRCLLCVPEKATKQTPNGPASGSGASCRLRNVVECRGRVRSKAADRRRSFCGSRDAFARRARVAVK